MQGGQVADWLRAGCGWDVLIRTWSQGVDGFALRGVVVVVIIVVIIDFTSYLRGIHTISQKAV